MAGIEPNNLQNEYNDIGRRIQCLEQRLSILRPDTKAYRKAEADCELLSDRALEILFMLSEQSHDRA